MLGFLNDSYESLERLEGKTGEGPFFQGSVWLNNSVTVDGQCLYYLSYITLEVAFINILGLYWALSIRKKGVELRRNDANRSKMYNKRLFPLNKGIYIRFALQGFCSWKPYLLKRLKHTNLAYGRNLQISPSNQENQKVASSGLSWLVAHPRIFKLFMKGKFDAYLLWPFAKEFEIE